MRAEITEIIVIDQSDRTNPVFYYVYPQGEQAYVPTGDYPTLGFNIRVRNSMDTPQRLWCRITGDDGYTLTLTTSTEVQPGSVVTFGPAAPMPSKAAYNVKIEVGVYNSDFVEDSYDVKILNPDFPSKPPFIIPILIFVGLMAAGLIIAIGTESS